MSVRLPSRNVVVAVAPLLLRWKWYSSNKKSARHITVRDGACERHSIYH